MATGRPWQGRIGKAEVTLTVRGAGVDWGPSGSPKGYSTKLGGRRLRWTFTDFEPSQDPWTEEGEPVPEAPLRVSADFYADPWECVYLEGELVRGRDWKGL